jgi:hypothetical protein
MELLLAVVAVAVAVAGLQEMTLVRLLVVAAVVALDLMRVVVVVGVQPRALSSRLQDPEAPVVLVQALLVVMVVMVVAHLALPGKLS